MPKEYDPEAFGKVLARLDNQDRILNEQTKDIRTLLDMANQGRGGLLMLMTLGSGFGAAALWLVQKLFVR